MAAPPPGAGGPCGRLPGHDGPHEDAEGITWAAAEVDVTLTAADEQVTERDRDARESEWVVEGAEAREVDEALVNSTLIANGFVELRKQALGVLAGMAGFEVELLDVMIAYLDRKRASAEVRNASNGSQIADNLDLDRWRLEALREFRVKIDELERRWQARQELRK